MTKRSKIKGEEKGRRGTTLRGTLRGFLCCFFVALGPAQTLEEFAEIEAALRVQSELVAAATVSFDLGEGMSGSGVIISEEGLMMSAAHVTQEVGKKFEVLFMDGRRAAAVSLGLDSRSDAALAQLQGETGEAFPYVVRRRDTGLTLGQWVFALGHAGGFDEGRGAVLRIGRLLAISSTSLKTDCTLIGGDSGGPLFDLSGQLIGIHSRVGKVTSTNLHVPLAAFEQHWDSLMAEEFLGEGPFAVPSVRLYGMKIVPFDGRLFVEEVEEGSPAMIAGVTERALLLAVAQTPVETLAELRKVQQELLGQGNTPEEGIVFRFENAEQDEVVIIKEIL